MSRLLPRPQVSPAQPWRFPEPVELDLPNGARVWLYDLPGQHVLSCQVVLDAPVSLEAPELEGLATIAVRTSDEGSELHPGAELAELLEDQGATYSGAATQSATIARMEVPDSRLTPALDVLAEIVTRPAFASADVERHVALRLAEIEQAMVRSSQLTALGFQRAVFDRAIRVGRPTAGRAGTVAAITPDAVAAFHRDWWRPDGATIVLAGELPADAHQQLAAAFADWTPGAGRVTHQQTRANPQAPVVWVIDRPESVQADIQIGALAPDRHDPRWAALDVAACAMGGSFGSRLNRVLREELGYTYGAHADFRPLRSGGTFAVRTSCRTEVAAAAVRQALDLLAISDDPFTAAEIADARTYLLGIAPLHFQTAEVIADQAAAMVAAGMRPDWVNQHQARVAEITADQANAAFAEVVVPRQLGVVLCGDAAALVDALAAEGLAAEVIDPEQSLA